MADDLSGQPVDPTDGVFQGDPTMTEPEYGEPAIKFTGHKAWVATALSFIATFVGVWVADEDPFTAKEIAQGLVFSGTACGLIGGATYYTKNRVKR